MLLNSKGFGGNNATGAVLSPSITRAMLEKRHGKKAMAAHDDRCAEVTQRANDYDNRMISEGVDPIYQFGEGVIQGEELSLSDRAIGVPGFPQEVSLEFDNPYEDMTESSD